MFKKFDEKDQEVQGDEIFTNGAYAFKYVSNALGGASNRSPIGKISSTQKFAVSFLLNFLNILFYKLRKFEKTWLIVMSWRKSGISLNEIL